MTFQRQKCCSLTVIILFTVGVKDVYNIKVITVRDSGTPAGIPSQLGGMEQTICVVVALLTTHVTDSPSPVSTSTCEKYEQLKFNFNFFSVEMCSSND